MIYNRCKFCNSLLCYSGYILDPLQSNMFECKNEDCSSGCYFIEHKNNQVIREFIWININDQIYKISNFPHNVLIYGDNIRILRIENLYIDSEDKLILYLSLL